MAAPKVVVVMPAYNAGRTLRMTYEELPKDAVNLVILVDDAERENEGDLVLAAEHVTPEAINFMAKYARGLICLSLTEEQVKRLGLTMMVQENESTYATAFTVSIEAAHGVTTGISALRTTCLVMTALSAMPLARAVVT